MGPTHAETLAHRTRGTRLVVVTTWSAERAGQIGDSCGEAAIYASVDQLPETERLDARATVAVSLAATRSIRDGRPVDVDFGRPERMAKKGVPSSSQEGRQRRNRKV